jgi:protein-tyrosine phosphatase
MPAQTNALLFVCMGNICRSPLAEGVFLHLANQRGLADRFTVDSCGTGAWHAGEEPDRRSIAVAKKHGITLPSIARQLRVPADFEDFDLLIAMDQDNIHNMLEASAPANRIRLLRSFDPALAAQADKNPEVPDPYYGQGDGFQLVYDMILNACIGLLDELADAD